MTRFFRSVFFRWFVLPPLGGLSLLFLAGTIGWYAMRHAGAVRRNIAVAELDATDPLWRTTALTEARNAGLPPADQNAALQAKQVYERIPRAFKAWTKDEKLRKDLKPGHLPHPEDVRPARQALVDASAALEKARRIRHLPGGGFPLTFADPIWISTLMPDIQNTRQVAILLDTHALIAAYDRKGDEAVESVLACLAVGRGLGDEPTLISQLVRIAEVAIAARSAERVLGLCEASDAKLAELQTAFATEAEAPRMLYGLRGERAGFQRITESMDDEALTPNALEGARASALDRVQAIPIRATVPEQQATGLRMFNRMIEAAKMPYGAARRSEMSAIEAEFPTMPRYRTLILRLLLPAVTKVNEADTRTAALLRCASVALACERYRMKNEQYPESLADLKELLPAVPADPYTGRPLLYKRTDDGAVVYCTGLDRRDDGGTELDAAAQKGDFGFRLFDPPHRRRPPLPRTESVDVGAGISFDQEPASRQPPSNPAPALSPRKR